MPAEPREIPLTAYPATSDRVVHVLSARLDEIAAGEAPSLAAYLARVPDHRRAQGLRHSLPSVLQLACAAVTAGARSLVAIAEWAADAPEQVLDGMGVRRDPCGGALVPPSETTIRRALSGTDPDELDRQLGAWVPNTLRTGVPEQIAVSAKDVDRPGGERRDHGDLDALDLVGAGAAEYRLEHRLQ
jgi:hypothetical protein